MVRPSELPQRIERALRDGLGHPELRVRSIRAGDTAARALRERDAFAGTLGLDVMIADTPTSPERMLPVIVRITHDTSEIDVYRHFARRSETRGFLPAFYGAATVANESTLVMERIQNAILLDTADDVSGWHPPMRWRMIEALAAIHAVGFAAAPESPQELPEPAALRERVADGRRHHPRVVTAEVEGIATGLIDSIADWSAPSGSIPRTLVHGAFSPEHLCFRDDRTPVVFGWTHTQWDEPQRDLADLLASTLQPGFEQGGLWEPVERHRLALARAARVELDGAAWRVGLRRQLRLGLLTRVAAQWASPISPYVARLTAVTTELVRRTS